MTERVKQHAAKMRCLNTNQQLRRLLRRLEAAKKAGRISPAEARSLVRDFWDQRLEDKKLAAAGARVDKKSDIVLFDAP